MVAFISDRLSSGSPNDETIPTTVFFEISHVQVASPASKMTGKCCSFAAFLGSVL